MASNKLTIGSTTINLPPSFNYDPGWLESVDRTLDGSLIVNQTVTTGDTAVQKKRFSFSGVQKFSSGFAGSTTTSASLNFLGSTYSVHIVSENYRFLFKATSGNVLEYSYIVEEV